MPRTFDPADFNIHATDELDLRPDDEPIPEELMSEKERIEREALAPETGKKPFPFAAWVGNLIVPGFGPAFMNRTPLTLALLGANLVLMVVVPSPLHFLQSFFGPGGQLVSFDAPLSERALIPLVGFEGARSINQTVGGLLYLQVVLVVLSWLWLMWLTWRE